MKIILATAYAVNPYKGSEDGMGWNFILQIARFQRVIAITRENNRPAIAQFMQEYPDSRYENIQFLYYDLPYWMRFWKKGSRGAMVYYWMWQKGIIAFIRRQNIRFDVVHNLNFHNDWTPSWLWKLDKPFVWGPVGHHPSIPVQYLTVYNWKYRVKECMTLAVKNYFWKWSPALYRTRKKADFTLAMNSSAVKKLNLPADKFAIVPSVATEDFGWIPTMNNGRFTVLSAGRFVPLKGFDLSIAAFAAFIHSLPDEAAEKCQFIVVGSGPEEHYYRKLAQTLKVEKYIRYIPWIDRTAVLDLFRNASVFLFPSHEGAGMVVAEALSFGVPVICLKNEGPGEFVTPESSFAIPVGNRAATIQGLADDLHTLFLHPALHQQMRQSARQLFLDRFHWDRRGEQLNTVYNNI